MRFDVGALDLCEVRSGARDSDIVWEKIELAPQLESFGYSCYWLAEHHNERIALSTPELLVPVLAGSTRRMRIGVAGVLLRLHSPFKVAKTFRLLHALFPGRIDLGIARGGVPDVVRKLLLGRYEEKSYEEKIVELLAFLRGTGEIAANPIGIKPPAIWILGSKEIGAGLAAQNGTSFCFAKFLTTGSDKICLDAISRYRDNFRPNSELAFPRWSVAVAGVCAATVRQASDRLGASAFQAGHPKVGNIVATVVGDPEHCKSMFLSMAKMFDTKRFIFLDMSPTPDARIESYKLLAEALKLEPGVLDPREVGIPS